MTDSSNHNESQSASEKVENHKNGLFDSILNMKPRITRPPPRNVHTTTMPGLISMDRDLTLPPEVPTRPDSKEPILQYSQQRDYKALLSHDDKCGNGSHAAADLNLKNFNYETDIFLIMVIKSSCALKQRRDAVRKTWGDEEKIKETVGVNIRRLFLLGDCTSDSIRNEVIAENEKYGDLLVWNFFDSFRNLTLKDCLFLQWYSRWCRNVPYIFKGDDDVFVNTKNIVQYLKELPVDKRKNLFLGSVLRGSPRILDPKWKYYVSYNLYPEKIYPPYVSGGGFIMSNSMAARLFRATLTTRIIPIDDAFLGILLKKIGVEPQNDKTFKSWGMKKTNVCRLAKIKTFHKVSPEQLLQYWKEYSELDISKCDSVTDDVFKTQQKK